MQIPKEQVLAMIRERGAEDHVRQADQELPDPVDTDQHQDWLERLGVSPKDLIGRLGGGLGGKLGL